MRHVRMLGLCLVAVFAVSALSAATALAATREWKPFRTCPIENPEVEACTVAESGGESQFSAGKVTVPLAKPITLSLGFAEEESGELHIFGPEVGGSIMSKVAQPVPGGLEAYVNPALLSPSELVRYEKALAGGHTKVTAMVEMAGLPGAVYLNEVNFLFAEGEALGLPTQVKLSNQFLGPACYVGSNLHPIDIKTTTGTSGALTGHTGTLESNPTGEILTIHGARLVDATFAVPGVSNCGVGGGADAAVDSGAGLPSPSGGNTVILEGTLKQASANAVRRNSPR
jgi:hypothetical protein